MDSTSNGLGKLLPKAIAAKRRRNKAASSAETAVSSNSTDGLASRGPASLASLSTGSSDANSIDDSRRSSQDLADQRASCESDAESYVYVLSLHSPNSFFAHCLLATRDS